jgi:hypothetical protein
MWRTIPQPARALTRCKEQGKLVLRCAYCWAGQTLDGDRRNRLRAAIKHYRNHKHAGARYH